MNKKGFSNADLINIIKIGAGLILLYIIYKVVMSKINGL